MKSLSNEEAIWLYAVTTVASLLSAVLFITYHNNEENRRLYEKCLEAAVQTKSTNLYCRI